MSRGWPQAGENFIGREISPSHPAIHSLRGRLPRGISPKDLHWNGAVAQLGERVVRNDEVRGSIPLGSTRCTAKSDWAVGTMPDGPFRIDI